MDKILDIEILSPEKTVFKGLAMVVTVPGVDGLFQVLNMHAPMVSMFETGIITVQDEKGNKIHFSTRGGVAEVLDNKVTILADAAEAKDDIDVERAEKAAKRAEDRLGSGDKSIDRERAKLSLQRARIRLKVAGVLK
ncbi:MAG: ATP synthase F1 subunit epsilon [Bacteroidetes bacterium]|nr:ATP synthase F1 subunit epsilon [Bacteroidota bacterium]